MRYLSLPLQIAPATVQSCKAALLQSVRLSAVSPQLRMAMPDAEVVLLNMLHSPPVEAIVMTNLTLDNLHSLYDFTSCPQIR